MSFLLLYNGNRQKGRYQKMTDNLIMLALVALMAALIVCLFILLFKFIRAPKNKEKGKRPLIALYAVSGVIIVSAVVLSVLLYRNNGVYYAENFGFTDIESPNDADGDGIDDYSDMVAGARAYIESDPFYKSAYYGGGYPTDNYGVCTDVIWQAFKAAGYLLKDMVDADIDARHADYFDEGEYSDSNIDFRRVRNLLVFFTEYAEALTTSTDNPEDWMPGDIVIYDGHIAICSDKRNAQGLPFIIHLGNPIENGVEANQLTRSGYGEVIGHFRYNP